MELVLDLFGARGRGRTCPTSWHKVQDNSGGVLAASRVPFEVTFVSIPAAESELIDRVEGTDLIFQP